MRLLRRISIVLTALLLLVMAAPMALAATNWVADDAKLLDLMAVAEQLQQEDYTAQSWQALDDAMVLAHAAVESGNQHKIDEAASQVATAFSQMVPMDFTALNAVLASAQAWTETDDNMDLQWDKLLAQLKQMEQVKASGDQAAVDELAAQIEQTLTELKSFTADEKDNTLPWMILFAVSMALNIVLVIMVMLRTRHVVKVQKDDVPLVDYDIDDDMD